MTANQAYQILNVNPGASQREIEQAYKAALSALQLQSVPGQPVTVRQKAQTRIVELKAAFEFLKNATRPGTSVSPVGGRPQPQVRPTVHPHVQPAATPGVRPATPPPARPAVVPPIRPATIPQVRPGGIPQIRPVPGPPAAPTSHVPIPLSPPSPAYSWVMPAGFVLAAVVMLFIILRCVRSDASAYRNGTARLRVLSVPWSRVEVDGESLGPSGQVDAFVLRSGDHKLVLSRENRAISRTISLSEDSETIIKAQLEKGKIDVSHKPD